VSTAAYPTVIAALVTTAQTAAAGAFRVVRGYDLSDDPSDVMLIGVPHIADVSTIAAGSITQKPAAMGTPRSRDEEGSIFGVVMARNGQGDQAAACNAAFAYLASLETAIRADPTLGTAATFKSLVAQFSAGDVFEDQIDGAATAVEFTVTYKARL
jgi:hypothetical protein